MCKERLEIDTTGIVLDRVCEAYNKTFPRYIRMGLDRALPSL